jgi:hypothetical protein
MKKPNQELKRSGVVVLWPTRSSTLRNVATLTYIYIYTLCWLIHIDLLREERPYYMHPPPPPPPPRLFLLLAFQLAIWELQKKCVCIYIYIYLVRSKKGSCHILYYITYKSKERGGDPISSSALPLWFCLLEGSQTQWGHGGIWQPSSSIYYNHSPYISSCHFATPFSGTVQYR